MRCVLMQGGQGDIKHWAFNDPPKRTGKWKNEPPPPAEYRKLSTRVVELHPITLAQNARTSGGGPRSQAGEDGVDYLQKFIADVQPLPIDFNL